MIHTNSNHSQIKLAKAELRVVRKWKLVIKEIKGNKYKEAEIVREYSKEMKI